MREREIQKSILDYLGYQRDIYFFRAGSGLVKLEQGRWFKTGKAGCPDIIICIRGLFIGLEVKNEKGKLSETQIMTKKNVERANGVYEVVRSVDDVEKLLNIIR